MGLSQLEIIDPQKTTSHRAKITVPRLPEYYIASPETVLVTLPASAVRSGQTVVASPVFEIRPATPVAVIDAPDFEYEDEIAAPRGGEDLQRDVDLAVEDATNATRGEKESVLEAVTVGARIVLGVPAGRRGPRLANQASLRPG